MGSLALSKRKEPAGISGRVTKRSNVFRIPRTTRQEPGTTLPNPPYDALSLTYANSRKSNPRPNTGYKRPETEKSRGLEAKKAHLEWLHGRAIPDMDREIMKTNVLVDNILAEQTELDTQMLAIRAMGGVEAYNNAYKAHEGLRRAIGKRLRDTKKKRAQQFESIRSMQTMLRTLVAEIDENVDNRHNILRSRRGSTGISTCFFDTNYKLNSYLFLNITNYTGPNPRLLLRPDVNRDCNNMIMTSTTTSSTSLPTPPTTPRCVRCVGQPPHSQMPINIFSPNSSRSPSVTVAGAPEPDPVFSNDYEDSFHLEAILSPISSPTPNGPETYQPVPPQNKRRCNSIRLVSLSNSSDQTTHKLHPLILSYYYTYVKINLDAQCNRTQHKGRLTPAHTSAYLHCRYPTPCPNPVVTPYTQRPYSPTPLDPLQAAALAAGIADDDESTTHSIDCPLSPSHPNLPSPPDTPISSPNRLLLVPPIVPAMPKNKSKGTTGDTPTKSPRTGGRPLNTHDSALNQTLTSHGGCNDSLLLIKILELLRAYAIMQTIDSAELRAIIFNMSTLTSFFNIVDLSDDILDMSGVQEGEGSDHSSDLDSTIQEEQAPPGVGQDQAKGQTPKPAQRGRSMGLDRVRQSKTPPSPATLRVTPMKTRRTNPRVKARTSQTTRTWMPNPLRSAICKMI